MNGQDVVFLFFLQAMVTVITAQVPIAPLPAHSSGYAKYKDRFFIHGGVTTGGNANADNISGQFFYLDLSKRWTSVSPAWNKLPEGPKNVSEIALSLDGKILVAFIGNPIQAIHGFSFESRTWSISKVSFQNSTKGIFPVTLGQDGTVLIAGGSSLDNVYHIYSFDVDSLVTHSLPPSPFPGKKFLPGREFYQAVWSELFKSAFFFGGSIYGVFAGNASTANILSVYNAETKAWTERETTGFGEGNIFGHCMAISESGQMIVSFGGTYIRPTAPAILRDGIQLFDVDTGMWRNGRGPGFSRTGHACTIAGDYFLTWGGEELNRQLANGNESSTPVYIYQISKDKWVQEYQPSPIYLNPNPSTSSTPSTSPLSGSPTNGHNIGVISGGAAGAIILVLIIGFFVWRKRRIAMKPMKQSDSDVGDDRHSSESKDTGSGQKENTRRVPRMPQDVSNLRSPQDTYGRGYDDDDDRHSNQSDDFDAKLTPSNPRAAPHYPSWGAHFEASYVADDPLYRSDYANGPGIGSHAGLWSASRRYPSSPISPYHHVVSPPPSSAPSVRRPRNPQAMEQNSTGILMVER